MLVFSFAAKQGIMPDSEYRYLGFQTACRFDKTRAVSRIKQALRQLVQDEGHLKELVYSYGPVAAGIALKITYIFMYKFIRTSDFKFKNLIDRSYYFFSPIKFGSYKIGT